MRQRNANGSAWPGQVRTGIANLQLLHVDFLSQSISLVQTQHPLSYWTCHTMSHLASFQDVSNSIAYTVQALNWLNSFATCWAFAFAEPGESCFKTGEGRPKENKALRCFTVAFKVEMRSDTNAVMPRYPIHCLLPRLSSTFATVGTECRIQVLPGDSSGTLIISLALPTSKRISLNEAVRRSSMCPSTTRRRDSANEPLSRVYMFFCMISYKFPAASRGLLQDPRGVNYVTSYFGKLNREAGRRMVSG